MVAEMTGEYSLIVPAMLATMVAYLITGETSIYESQVDTRLDSPAHKDDYALPLLQSLTVRQAMERGKATAGPDTPVTALSAVMREYRVASVLIVENGALVGLVTATDIAHVPPQDAEITRARQIMSRRIVRAYLDESLYRAWLRMARRGFRQLAVVDHADSNRLLGVVTMSTIGRILRQAMAGSPNAAGSGSMAIPALVGAGRSVSGQATGPVEASATAAAPLDASGARTSARGDNGTQPHRPAPEDEQRGRSVPLGGPFGERPHALLEENETEVEEHEQEENEEPALSQAPQPRPADSNPLEVAALHRATRAPVEGDPLVRLTVANAMLRSPRLVPETEPLAGVRARLDHHGRALVVVNANGDLVGIVTASDLRGRSAEEAGRPLMAGDVAVRRLVTARPDETLRSAARRMSRLGLRQLPVVAPDSARPLGLLRRSDILQAYVHSLGEDTTGPQPALEEQAQRP
jgi:CBS domain-containing protein